MISSTLVTVLLAFAPFVVSQSSTGAVQVQAIEAHFEQSHIIPDLLPSFNPSALLSLNYPGVGDLGPGQLLRKEQVANAPTISATPANNTVKLSDTYTLVMVDADVVGANLSKGATRHWLVNGVTVINNQVSNSSATAVTAYAGPWPAPGSGPHRYVVLIYQQPQSFNPPADLSQPGVGVSVFDLNGYAKNSGLGPLIAATYMQVEEGQATMSIASTSEVVSSTLVAAGATGTSTSMIATGTGQSSGAGRRGTGVMVMSVIGMVGVVVGLVA
ncbi:hypothetical protein AMATHDRAFT_74152 [Amanita thiersii Skay4041]|uniref:PEBP-like protein n=1 Tax=Amanita thiersii Skay4041 TaxID=703135 RepID=A0A2A9NX88_9AGAR|nr:hypothetical protein AMATHDRAFT_74152 [Amanita thiersii Skay4041]